MCAKTTLGWGIVSVPFYAAPHKSLLLAFPTDSKTNHLAARLRRVAG